MVSGERLTRKGERGTLFLAISHIARGMLYLCKQKKTPSPAHFVPLRQGRRARSAEGVDKIANLLMAHRSNCIYSPLLQRGRGRVFLPSLYIIYNKVYSPSFRLLLSVLHSFFLFFLKNLSYSFAGLRKSHTFALAKREHLLRAKLEDVFVALRRKSSLTDFHRQKL